jgi:UDP-N-acetyl-D-galactosamine dehydrogenase
LDGAYDCVVGAVPHDKYAAFTRDALAAMVSSGGLIVDLKGMWRSLDLGPDIKRMEI